MLCVLRDKRTILALSSTAAARSVQQAAVGLPAQGMVARCATQVIILKQTNEFIGWAGLKYNTEEVNHKINFYDIGYRLDEKFWGKGYASEASFAWLKYAFETMNIKTIEAAAHAENVASNRILQKMGMQMTEQYLEDAISWNWYQLENENYK